MTVAVASFPAPDQIFQTNWPVYQKLISQNYLGHKELYAAVASFIDAHFTSPISMLDLGCGDASNLVEHLLSIPSVPPKLSSYTGVDESSMALQHATTNMSAPLAAHGSKVDSICSEMHNYVRSAAPAQYDFVFTSFALHHLEQASKQAFITAARKLLKPNGALLVVDVFMLDEEDRVQYMDRYDGVVRGTYSNCTPAEIDMLMDHITTCDLPEYLGTFEKMAAEAGFSRCESLAQCHNRFGRAVVMY